MPEPPAEFTRLHLYDVLNSLAEGVSLADASGRIVFSNEAADRILGTSSSTDAPEQWAEHYGVFVPNSDILFPAESFPLVRALEGEETRDVEMVIRNPNLSSEVVIWSSGRPLRDKEGAITGAAVVFRDVTRLRKTQRELERTNHDLHEAQRLKEELTAFIMHDLKNPLTTVTALTDLLIEEAAVEPAKLPDLMDIRAAALRMHRMVLDLLDVQLADDGALRPKLEAVPLRALFDEIETSVRGRARGFRAHHPDPELTVRADRALLVRVLVNLVDNCIKYGPAGGAIRLRAEAIGPAWVRLSVEDEGPGVPEALRERIFDKYAQAERVESHRTTDSRGLGLRFCKVATEAQDGRIWVEDGVPKGACFCIEIPAHRG